MANPEIDIQPLVRFLEFVPEGDLSLIVLKGHLLIEEQLVSLIERNLKQPSAIRQFRFAQRYRLAKAMYYAGKDDSVWQSIKILNNLRNHLAHKLEAAELQAKAKEFIASVVGLESIAGVLTSAGEMETIEQRMRYALILICGRLEGRKTE